MEKASKIVRVSYWKPKGTNDRVCCTTLENGYRAYGVFSSEKPVNKIEAKTQAFKRAMDAVNEHYPSDKDCSSKVFVYLSKSQIDFLAAVKVCAGKDSTLAVEDVARIQFISSKRAEKMLQELANLGIIEGLTVHKGVAHFERLATIENLY